MSFQLPDATSDVIDVHYNSDLSGEVHFIRRKPSNAQLLTLSELDELTVGELHIPGEVLLRFVAAHVANERVSKLEDMPWQDVLGI
jgi:hypothetical protein